MSSFSDLPKFDELKDKRKWWPAKPGSLDEGLGMLRYLTPAHVAQAVQSEVKTGERVCVNWDMTKLETPGLLIKRSVVCLSCFNIDLQVSTDFLVSMRLCQFQIMKAL